MNFTGSREITSLLTTRVEGGNPPDVALPAEIGLFQRFAKEGKLTPLYKCPGLEDELKANYPQSFLDLGTVNGTLYGFFMKADSKATIWYNPQVLPEQGYKPLDRRLELRRPDRAGRANQEGRHAAVLHGDGGRRWLRLPGQ